MKHILNNLSEEEKNAIREQHTGGMKVMTENFNKLINSKLGDSKPLTEQSMTPQPNSEIISTLNKLGFDLVHPMMDINDKNSPILMGLEEFREHLGGELTIMLLEKIGQGIEVHEIDPEILKKASHLLRVKA